MITIAVTKDPKAAKIPYDAKRPDKKQAARVPIKAGSIYGI